jgi:FtsZ-binding cell division protein ZapB
MFRTRYVQTLWPFSLVPRPPQATSRLESTAASATASAADLQAEVTTLKESIALANTSKEELSREGEKLRRELKSEKNKLGEVRSGSWWWRLGCWTLNLYQ